MRVILAIGPEKGPYGLPQFFFGVILAFRRIEEPRVVDKAPGRAQHVGLVMEEYLPFAAFVQFKGYGFFDE